MNTYALVGKNIAYSFSRNYFKEKFEREGIANSQYVNFDIQSIEELQELLHTIPNVRGLHVTIPYKREIIPLLHDIDPTVYAIGAVNTIKVTPNGLIGFNTDCYGFSESLQPLLQPHHNKALILGTGGASGAVAYALKQLGIVYRFVSRTPNDGQLGYNELTQEILQSYSLIINCTPLGTYPNIDECPPLPYQYITSAHLLYDLLYNPPQTAFLTQGIKRGAATCNGQYMLELQAEKAWEIWQTL